MIPKKEMPASSKIRLMGEMLTAFVGMSMMSPFDSVEEPVKRGKETKPGPPKEVKASRKRQKQARKQNRKK